VTLSRTPLEIDRSVPCLMMKIGRSPLHHGCVGAVRSLGRLGVPVYAVTEDRLTPTARSRHLRRAFVWPTTGAEDPRELLDGMVAIAKRIARRSVVVTTDDESALLVAEHADELREWFHVPDVEPGLPRRLASKGSLAELCAQHGVPAPAWARPSTRAELLERAVAIGFPVVLKNDAAFERLARPAVHGTTVVRDAAALERLATGWSPMPGVVVQELLPHDRAEDWIVHVHCAGDGRLLSFTGVKLRSLPPNAGVTAVSLPVENPPLRELAAGFCAAVGFRGIADMDWRLDLRDGRYKLLDFNPRVGAQFRMFDTQDGVDVVRALHLDLTGRPLPIGRQIDDRRFVVGNLALPAWFGYRDARTTVERYEHRRGGGVERAWLAADDPLPGVITAVRSLRPLAGLLVRPDFRRGIAGASIGG
jgi:D-aspartate ligase